MRFTYNTYLQAKHCCLAYSFLSFQIRHHLNKRQSKFQKLLSSVESYRIINRWIKAVIEWPNSCFPEYIAFHLNPFGKVSNAVAFLGPFLFGVFLFWRLRRDGKPVLLDNSREIQRFWRLQTLLTPELEDFTYFAEKFFPS